MDTERGKESPGLEREKDDEVEEGKREREGKGVEEGE